MKAIARIAKFLCWLATLAGISLSFFTFISVVMRYFLGTPFHFTEELVGLLFCSMSLLAFPIAEKERVHIRLEILITRLKPKPRLVARSFSLIVLVCFCGVLLYHGYNYMVLSYRLDARTDSANMLIYPWVIVLLVALLVFVGVIISQVVASVYQKVPEGKEGN